MASDGVRSLPAPWNGQRAFMAAPLCSTSTPLSSITSDSVAASFTSREKEARPSPDALASRRGEPTRASRVATIFETVRIQLPGTRDVISSGLWFS